MKSIYQTITCVNLIDKKPGNHGTIGDTFTKLCTELNLDYVWFDFHAECKKMQWGNLSKLVTIIEPQMKDYGFFEARVGIDRKY